MHEHKPTDLQMKDILRNISVRSFRIVHLAAHIFPFISYSAPYNSQVQSVKAIEKLCRVF
jgi:hypothetical protein